MRSGNGGSFQKITAGVELDFHSWRLFVIALKAQSENARGFGRSRTKLGR